MIVGYTTGVFDLFHIGHLNLLRNAKSLCDRLIVGVTVDAAVAYKNKKAVIPFEERLEIVRSNRFVDAAIPQSDHDKIKAWKRLHYNVLFVGDDWYESSKWQDYEAALADLGVRIVYFPYTQGVSSTLLNNVLLELRSK